MTNPPASLDALDWDAILDGKQHALEQGTDWLGPVDSLLMQVRRRAQSRNLTVDIDVDNDRQPDGSDRFTITVRAAKPADNSAPKAQKGRKK